MGQNPYLDTEDIPPPKKAYKLHLRNTGEIYDVDPDALSDHHDGHKCQCHFVEVHSLDERSVLTL